MDAAAKAPAAIAKNLQLVVSSVDVAPWILAPMVDSIGRTEAVVVMVFCRGATSNERRVRARLMSTRDDNMVIFGNVDGGCRKMCDLLICWYDNKYCTRNKYSVLYNCTCLSTPKARSDVIYMYVPSNQGLTTQSCPLRNESVTGQQGIQDSSDHAKWTATWIPKR